MSNYGCYRAELMRDLARKEQMVRSIDPEREAVRQFQWPLQAADVLGTRAAETILASDHVRSPLKAAHMEASDQIKLSAQPLQEGAVHI